MNQKHLNKNIYEINSIVPIIHDLATPISSIEATFILMESYKIKNQDIKLLIKTGREALNLTKNILTTKDTLLKNLTITGFNSSESIIKVVSALSNYSQNEGINIKLDLDHNILIHGKEHVFQRIILNILSNSIKELSKVNKPVKEISIREEVFNDSYKLSIKDNGNGFKKSDPFGIGLNVVKDNLKTYFRGKLVIDTKLNEYTAINIYLSDFCKK